MTRTCLDCPKPLGPFRPDRPSTGYCRVCAPKHAITPARNARVAEAARQRHARERDDPAKYAAKVASGQRLRDGFSGKPEVVVKQVEGRRRSLWVPEGYEAMNRTLIRKKFKTDERKAIIADEVAKRARSLVLAEQARVAALTPLERQAEQMRRGVRLVEKFTPRMADHAFTLGGVASGQL
jgi:hypothetical protein